MYRGIQIGSQQQSARAKRSVQTWMLNRNGEIINTNYLWEVVIYFFNIKKSATEVYRRLSEAYGEAVISERTSREWYQRYKVIFA